MEEAASSPKIVHLSWGRVEVSGAAERYKDAKLYPGGSREWDWNETGTAHVPGVQPADLEELLDHGAEVVVLSRGQLGALRVPAETLDWLRERGVETHVHRTREAVERYNELSSDRPVGALIHSTC
jgi:hypothetical protein